MSTMIIFETKRMRNNWEEYTGRFRCTVKGESSMMIFNLPGRGGRVTKKAASEIKALFDQGVSAGEIAQRTGCELHNAV